MQYIQKNLKRLLICCVFLTTATSFVIAQGTVSAANYKVGEKLTYTVSLNSISDIGYFDLNVVSSGRIGNADAIEVRSRFKTLDIAIGAFYYIDETRTTFLSSATGLPLYSKKTDHRSGLPKDIISDHRTVPAVENDLNTLIYALRNTVGSGALTFQENGRSYTVNYTHGKTATVTNAGGIFETSIVSVESDYLTELGISHLKVNISTDEAKIPARWHFKTSKGSFKVDLTSVVSNQPNTGEILTTGVVPTPTPVVAATPKPVATPTPYLPNQPISSDLAFELGENLEYRISSNGRELGSLVLRAESRQLYDGRDGLKLSAKFVNILEPAGVFGNGGEVVTIVDPLTLSPRRLDIKLSGQLASMNQTALFDDRTNSVSFGAARRIEAPVGTHNILSLIYATRSFNLKPSRSSDNPVNDTRVAVFWGEKASIFTLRPTDAEIVNINGEKISGQLISISNGDPQFDILAPKLWLGNDDRRLPLRLSIGAYQIDLVSNTVIPIQ